MATIQITKIHDTLFEVAVAAGSNTVHQVSVQADYAQKLTGSHMNIEELLKKSFEFLLARESNTSILRNFDLSVVARYFPEFEREIMCEFLQ